jgi:hypothetical protein
MDFSAALERILGDYVAAVAVLLVGFGWLIWTLATKIKGMRNEVDKIKDLPCDNHSSKLEKLSVIETKIDDFPCHAHTVKIDRHHDQLAVTNELLRSLEGKMDMLVRLIPQGSGASKSILSDDVPPLAQKNSPKALNDNGRLVSSAFGCDDFLTANSEWLLDGVAKFDPKTALDVEMYSLAALKVASTDDRFNELKNKIYNSPAISLKLPNGQSKDVEIGLDDVLFVLSLPLRDLYLSRHPEIM